MLNNKNKFSGFTLVEVLISVTIFSMIIVAGFQALSAVGIGKIKLIAKTDIEKEAFFASEKFFELIKKGGTIDYEEYFNRKVVSNLISDANKTAAINEGHYTANTGYGNFGEGGDPGNAGVPTYGAGFYYCRSSDTDTYGDDNADGILFGEDDINYKLGCAAERNNYDGVDIDKFDNDYVQEAQRFGQYSFSFIDYNGDKNDDRGDINGDGSPIIDDDDEPLGTGPIVFDSGEALPELYLLNINKKERILFRWTIKQDDDSTKTCDASELKTGGDGCIGNIEFLRLSGKDFGLNHNPAVPSFGLNDGVIDTWTIDDEFSGGTDVVAGSDNVNYRQPIFPNTMNVKDLKFVLYPNKDNKLAWKDDYTSQSNISPFVKIYMTITPSAKKIRGIAGEIPEIKIATTINLGSN